MSEIKVKLGSSYVPLGYQPNSEILNAVIGSFATTIPEGFQYLKIVNTKENSIWKLDLSQDESRSDDYTYSSSTRYLQYNDLGSPKTLRFYIGFKEDPD